ncbi:MAG: nitroreductase family protein [Verrucomicrobia bacterium]|nr:nitroreductase family protein [Verrucomicrobiota bacterium]
MKTEIASAVTETLLYHEQTKHHFHRYARSLGFLDWANQPNPFRFYEGVTAVRLPLLQKDPASEHLALYGRSRNAFQDFTRETIGAFLELSLGLSAWKSIPGSTWALRMNPSSGNLHPTEAYLVLPAPACAAAVACLPWRHRQAAGRLPGVTAGVFHYSPYLHALEPRAEVPETLWRQIREHFHTDGFLVALTSIVWREAWKYGERAFRYCQHDVGHALAALSFSANLLGWQVTWLNAVSDEEIAGLLGFDQTQWPELEFEYPELLCFVHSSGESRIPQDLPRDIALEFSRLEFRGTPNRLSEEHVDWEIISRVAEATAKRQSGEAAFAAPGGPGLLKRVFETPALGSTGHWPVPSGDSPDGIVRRPQPISTHPFPGHQLPVPVGESPTGAGESPAQPTFQTRTNTTRPFYAPTAQSGIPAAQIIRQRRSAVAFDGVTGISKDQFRAMLDKTLPREACAPFDLGLSVPCVHLLLFVHRVTGLEPGLYFLLRAERDLPALQRRCHGRFHWRLVEDALPLYLLQAGDFRSTATSVSCRQSIAGDGAFSLGMIARFREEIEAAPYRYRHLFWETGMIGQVLYLEAEAQGVRATGIGCFFDDPVHEVMGLPDNAFQSLYHFTVGGPREDKRLATRAAYHHLEAPAR